MKHAGRARLAGLKIALLSLVIVLAVIGTGSFLTGRIVPAVALSVGAIWLLFLLFCLSFFRDPEAAVPGEAGTVVSPGHGTVDVIDETTEKTFLGGRCRRVSIFLSVFDVHVQNAPISGRVAYLKHCPGKFVNAMRSDCGTYNENVLVGFESTEVTGERLSIRLIAGLIARRIVPWVAEGDTVGKGERISLIQFGSRVDVYLPMNFKVVAQLGQKVKGGETIIATSPNRMATQPEKSGIEPLPFKRSQSESNGLKIYLLPNLMTAGNLFCGFAALTKIVEADINAPNFASIIRHAIWFIFLACVFDLLDGRVARMGGSESPFGREFDSLADLISFGVAPAFLVHRIVLRDVFVQNAEVGWFIASIYVICGALRLARFNCLAAMPGSGGSKDFLGFPIPAAAGLVASLTMFLLWWDDRFVSKGNWRFGLPFIMIILSMMMVSEVKYPSFKKLDLRSTRPFTKMVIAILIIGSLLLLRRILLPFVLPAVFTAYLIYGFIRPRVSRQIRRELEDEDDDETIEPVE